MKSLNVIPILLASASFLGASLSFSSSASAQNTTYYCGRVDGAPATIAKTDRAEVVVIKWTKTMGSFDPQTRCRTVSARFQDHYNRGTLRFITNGTLNGQKIICVAQSRNGGCLPNGILFTLRPNENPRQFLVGLLNVSRYASSPAVIQNCIPKQTYDLKSDVYIDMAEFLNQCPPENAVTNGQQ